MTTQQELDLEARLADMERQLAEMAAKVNPLYSGGMDRYIHSGYLQWDGINLRIDKNGIQLPSNGAERAVLYFVKALTANSTSALPKSKLVGDVSDTLANMIVYADTSGVSTSALVQATASAFRTYWSASIGAALYQVDFHATSGDALAVLQLTNAYLRINGGSADPVGVADGSIWYNTTTDKLYARINGVTKELGGGGLKTSGGGYYLIPAGPSIGTSVSSSASADTYGSWTQMRAASGNALYIVGIDVKPADDSSLDYIQIDIGTGGAGSETSVGEAKTIARLHTISSQWGTYKIELPYPIPVAASTRIACRTADDVASGLSHVLTLHVIDQADLVSI